MAMLSESDRNLVFELATRLVSTCQDNSSRLNILVANVEKRVRVTRCSSLEAYLKLALTNKAEYANLISALTIHHTSWFREKSHFEMVEKWLFGKDINRGGSLKVGSFGCSTGEEVYSFAMLLEHCRRLGMIGDYQFEGFDIDLRSLEKAIRAIYPLSTLETIPQQYKSYLRQGSGKFENFFTLIPEIRSRCSFKKLNIASRDLPDACFDIVICRNILIYFDDLTVKRIVGKIRQALVDRGIMILGHSESLAEIGSGWQSLSHACYRKSNVTEPNSSSPIVKDSPDPTPVEVALTKILVVDDSPIVRCKLKDVLIEFGFEVQTASSAHEASQVIAKESFDLITLDVEMPGLDGPSWLHQQRQRGLRTPVIMITSLNVEQVPGILGALESGAQDFIEKKQIDADSDQLIQRVRALLKPKGNIMTIRSCPPIASAPLQRPDLILIGASTGGPQALHELLQKFLRPSPPIVVVQHISRDFATLFAERLAAIAGLQSIVVHKREPLATNGLYLGDGSAHLVMGSDSSGNLFIETRPSQSEDLHVPGIDYLFDSASRVKRPPQILALLLTGMGKDGAHGLLKLNKAGATTIAQDQASCVVFGMPREALLLGAATYQGNLKDIRRFLFKAVSLSQKASAI